MAQFHQQVHFGPSTPQPSSERGTAQLSYGSHFHRRQYPYGGRGLSQTAIATAAE